MAYTDSDDIANLENIGQKFRECTAKYLFEW